MSLIDKINKVLGTSNQSRQQREYTRPQITVVRTSTSSQQGEDTRPQIKVVSVTDAGASQNESFEITNSHFHVDKPELAHLYKSYQCAPKVPHDSHANGKVKMIKTTETDIEGQKIEAKIKADKEEIEKAYEEKAQTIADTISQKSNNPKDRLEALFRYFLRHCKYWDSYPKIDNGISPSVIPFKYNNLLRKQLQL